jgi:hypothetical protein
MEPISRAELEVRIHLPPADSPCLARTGPLQVGDPRVSRGCAPLGWLRGRQRRAGLGNITPIAHYISVGPFSGTAVPAKRFAHRGCISAKRGWVRDVIKL